MVKLFVTKGVGGVKIKQCKISSCVGNLCRGLTLLKNSAIDKQDGVIFDLAEVGDSVDMRGIERTFGKQDDNNNDVLFFERITRNGIYKVGLYPKYFIL